MSIPSLIPGVAYGPPARAAALAQPLVLPPRLVVIHDTSDTGTAAEEMHYAAARTDSVAAWTSAHAYIDTAGPLGSVPLNVQAWAAFSYANAHGWHLEMCGQNAGQLGEVPAITIEHTAALTAQLCALAGIPKVKLTPAQVAAGRSGICGHYDITTGLGVGTHDDPGPHFDWAAFMALVQKGDTVVLTPDDINAVAAASAKALLGAVVDNTATPAAPGGRNVAQLLGDGGQHRALDIGELPLSTWPADSPYVRLLSGQLGAQLTVTQDQLNAAVVAAAPAIAAALAQHIKVG